MPDLWYFTLSQDYYLLGFPRCLHSICWLITSLTISDLIPQTVFCFHHAVYVLGCCRVDIWLYTKNLETARQIWIATDECKTWWNAICPLVQLVLLPSLRWHSLLNAWKFTHPYMYIQTDMYEVISQEYFNVCVYRCTYLLPRFPNLRNVSYLQGSWFNSVQRLNNIWHFHKAGTFLSSIQRITQVLLFLEYKWLYLAYGYGFICVEQFHVLATACA